MNKPIDTLQHEALIARVKLGLAMQNLEPKTPITKRLSVAELKERLTWLEYRWKLLSKAERIAAGCAYDNAVSRDEAEARMYEKADLARNNA